MATTFGGFQIVQSALNAMQEAVDVAGQNVANASTPGYAEERAVLVSQPTVVQVGLGGPVADAAMGVGVDVSRVQRVGEAYLNAQVQGAQSNVSYEGQITSLLQNAQGLYNEPGSNGLSSGMQKFFTDMATLSANPQSSAARAVVGQDAANVADQFNSLSAGLSQLSGAVQNDLGVQVGQVNQTLTQVAGLNQQIQNAEIQHIQPTTLMDQRDQLLSALSKALAIRVGSDASGNLTVTDQATGALLVDGQQVGRLATGQTLTNAAGSATATAWQVVEQGLATTSAAAQPPPALANITSGQIGADLTLLGGVTYAAGATAPNGYAALAPAGNTAAYGQSLAGQLDQVASALATAVNNLQMPTGTGAPLAYYLDASGNPVSTAPAAGQPTGVPLFVNASVGTQTVPPSGITAANLAVNAAIVQSPYEIAAAQSPNAGDGSNAQAMADLGQSTAPGSAVPLYDGQVSGLGVVVATAQSQQTTAQSLLTQAKTMQQSVSGVSINNEIAHLSQYEDVYTAAAKALSAMQTMLQSLMAVIQ